MKIFHAKLCWEHLFEILVVWKNKAKVIVWNNVIAVKSWWFLYSLSIVRMAYRDSSVFGNHLSKPSEVLGSMKRSLGRKPKCQCKHHQKKLLEKQEEQRKQLQAKLVEKGLKRAFNTTYNKPYHGMKTYLQLTFISKALARFTFTLFCIL
jgi:hypothetical protein